MKILMPVLHYYPVIGGLEQWTQNIAEELSKKAEIFVVTGKVGQKPQEEIVKGVKIFRTSLYSLTDLSFSSLFYIFTTLPFIFLKSLGLIKKEKINLLHCQGFLSSFLGYLIFRLQKIPYVVTVQKLEEKKGFLRKLVYKNARICIVASVAIKKYFEEIGVKDIRIIPNGIHLEKFQGLDKKSLREKLGFDNEFLIITVGRLEIRKGFKYLISSIKFLEKELKGDDFSKIRLLIIGDGALRRKLENLVKKLSLKEKIKFLGLIPNEKIQEYLAACDCFVLPSLEEGFGIAILEAMASGLPVISTKVGGILDIIEDRENGILVEPKNSEELAGAILKIYSQEEFTKNLIERASVNLEKYNWENIAKEVSNIYSQLIS